MLREYALSIVVHVLAFGVRAVTIAAKNFPKLFETNERPYGVRWTHSRCGARWLFGTRERHGTGRRIHSLPYVIDEGSSLSVPVFCRFRENKRARKLDFYASKLTMFANMLILVFDDNLSIIISIPHCLLHSMKRKLRDLLSCHVMLHHVILSSKLVLSILEIHWTNTKEKKLGI